MVTNDLGAATILALIAMVLTRTAILRSHGVVATKFGVTDKTDFFIPPFALFYVYLILAAALHWPTVVHATLFAFPAAAWIGVALCAAALMVTALALVSFGASFRIGIDETQADELVTTGIFSVTRNPIYVAFALTLVGEFLILPNWIFLLYALAGFTLLHRQVLREEAFLVGHYGREYRAYRDRVHRYL